MQIALSSLQSHRLVFAVAAALSLSFSLHAFIVELEL